MAEKSGLRSAFNEAIAEVKRLQDTGMATLYGQPANPELEKLARELADERERAAVRGRIDRDWFQKTLKWVVGWAPESNLSLIAALGRIARASPTLP